MPLSLSTSHPSLCVPMPGGYKKEDLRHQTTRDDPSQSTPLPIMSSSSSPDDDRRSIETGLSLPQQPLLLSLPEDVLGIISLFLCPSDLCSLILTCRSLRASITSADKVWLPQCLNLASSFIPPSLLYLWRDALPSYLSLCRFLSAVAPLLGVWVHQNPELGNVVCVLPGFLSVVGCRIIPQEVGAMGISESSILFSPVFEILAGIDGSVSGFFLHGRDCNEDAIFPGSVKSIASRPNVLFLEVDEPLSCVKKQQSPRQLDSRNSPSFQGSGENRLLTSLSNGNLCRSDSTIPRMSSPAPLFCRLAFKDRRKLLELVASKVRLKVPSDLIDAPLFPSLNCGNDVAILVERWRSLRQLHESDCGRVDCREAKLGLDGRNCWDSSGDGGSCSASNAVASGKRRSFASTVGGYVKQMFVKGNTVDSNNLRSSGESKYVELQEFLRPRDAIGLSLRASTVKLNTYRGWPRIPDNRFALYKLPMQVPAEGKELAGLWGGTFGWPPRQVSEDKPGKALFFLVISYEEVDGSMLLFATKILEGTHYVLHPNGSAMFVVKVNEPSADPFPFGSNTNCQNVDVKQSFSGEGIANGYGFRYPGSKPGSLYLVQDGLLAFVWRESKAVLTLERLDLQELLRKGENVPAPPPIANFVYLTKSYSNVFSTFANNLDSSQPPTLAP